MNFSAGFASPSNFAERYESVLVPVIFQPWARELVGRAVPQNSEHILDLACGTGVVTREVLDSGVLPGSVTGVDMNADMLDVARARCANSGLDVEWVESDVFELPFPDARFDLAFCQQALQFFPERLGALRELRRVLRPGGRVAFCVSQELSRNPLLQSQAVALEKHVGQEAGGAVRAICCVSDEGEIRALFEEAGFGDIEIESVSLTLGHPDGRAFAAGAMAGMHTGDKLSEITEARRQQCIDDFLAGLGDCFDGTAICFPHVSHVIMARA